jgi:FAD/FMN-containing dehydrogenase
VISDAQLQALEQLFTSERVSVAGDDLAFYGQDWSKFVKPKPAAIVFPTERDEVQQLVRLAKSEKMALVPSGGRTWLVRRRDGSKGRDRCFL